MGPPGCADAQDFVGLWHCLQPIAPHDGAVDTDIVRGQDVRAAQVEHQEHLGGPATDPADAGEVGDDLFVGPVFELFGAEFAADEVEGEVADGGGLLAGEPAEAEGFVIEGGDLRGFGEGRFFEFEQAEEFAVDGVGGGAADLLEDDGAGERLEGVGSSGAERHIAAEVDDGGHGGVGGAEVRGGGGEVDLVHAGINAHWAAG